MKININLALLDKKEMVYIIMADVNDFKYINDVFCHLNSDKVPFYLISILKESLKV